ncbi:MAG: ferrous iron transport protein B [Paracoccaceae bacterium]|jgi:ferrous iron transport protein B
MDDLSVVLAAPVSAAILEVALVGAPNCGKTSLFNALTGGVQHVGNYAGVTVERKSGATTLPDGRHVAVIDLPGTHSLRARSLDEEVTRDVVLGRRGDERRPDLLLVVADATNLRGALRLVAELKRVGLPMVLVLNMIDIARHRGIAIDTDRLAEDLGVAVTTSTAVRRGGLDALGAALAAILDAGLPAAEPPDWTPPASSDLRAALREADRLVARAVREPERPVTMTTRIDAVLLHPAVGPAFLLLLLFGMFQAVFAGAAPATDLIAATFDMIGAGVARVIPPGLAQSFLIDGVIGGVGGVVVFLPQILVLFLFILVLEDFGYMARAAFLMDRLMGVAGLNGRAFIPLLSSFACAIPGIMATRGIADRRDRLTTIMVAPLMTCSARIPVYALIIAAFIPARNVGWGVGLQGLVMFALYAIGIFAAFAVSLAAKLLLRRNEPPAPLMLDLPDYKLPRARGILLGLRQRAWMFLARAGTTIFIAMTMIWVLSSFPGAPEGATDPAINYSAAAWIGRGLEVILAPVGFTWQICLALVPGMAAREVAVAGLATVYAVAGESDVGHALAAHWSLATALAFLAWYVFAPQCVSTLAVIRRETGSAKWMWVAVGYMFALAYVAAFATYRIALAMGGGL